MPIQSYNELFKADPVQFMRKYSVEPASRLLGDSGAHVADFPTPANKRDYTYKEMQGNRLIGYLDFQKIKHGTTATAATANGTIQMQQASGSDRGEGRLHHRCHQGKVILSSLAGRYDYQPGHPRV